MKELKAPSSPPFPSHIRVLVIEDNEDDYIIVKEFLSSMPFVLTWSPSASIARIQLAEAKFDLILLDHGLPDTNALSFLEELHEQYTPVPVIILTGHHDRALAISAIKKGATNYLLKDEIFEHLLPAMQNALGLSGPLSTPAPSIPLTKFVDTAEHVYHVLLETMNDGCLVVAPDGIITFVNEALGRFFGNDAHQLLGQNALTIFNEETRQNLQGLLTETAVFPRQQAISLEGSIQITNNKQLPVLISIRKLYNKTNQLEAYFVILTNISELIATRHELDILYKREKERNRKLQAVHEITTAASQLDSDNLMTELCRLISKEFGYYRINLGLVNKDEIRIEQRHRRFRDQIPDTNAPAFIINRQVTSIMTTAVNERRIIYTPDASQSPYYLPDPNAHIRSELAIPILSNQTPIAVLDIQSDEVNGLTQDDILLIRLMADRLAKSLENARLFQAVARERSRLSALIESSYEGIILVTKDRQIPVINPQAVKFLHLSGGVDNWVDRPLEEVLNQLKEKAPKMALTLLTESHRIWEGDITPKQGVVDIPPRTLHWQNLPVSTADVSLGWLLVLRDITQERLVETMRQDLTRTMVHDLRTPLTAILSSLQVLDRLDKLQQEQFSQRQRKFLDLSLQGTEKMLKLVNNILDVNQLESGGLTPNMVPVNLNYLVNEVITVQSVLAANKEIYIEKKIPKDLPLVQADANLIERVLQNLIDNAIKFTPTGGHIQIIAKLDPNQTDVYVTIADNGPGIPPEIRDHLFEKFVTGQHAEQGSGLGLAFCKLALEAHQKKIWIEDNSEQGAAFTFNLSVPYH